jgi:hypothetical protein
VAVVAAQPVLESRLEPITVSGSAIKIDHLPPEEWIKDIMRWKHMHLNEKFEKEFSKFRQVYPDYELPDELKKLIRE